MTTPPRIFAILPAAGMSRRMGQPKQLIPINNKPMLLTVLEPLTATNISAVAIVTRTDIANQLSLTESQNTTIVINDDDQSEMIDSIRLAITAIADQHTPAPTDGFLIIPADQPGLTPTDINRCITAFQSSPTHLVIAEHNNRRGHPLIFPASLAQDVHSPLCNTGLRELTRKHADSILTVPCPTIAVTRDIDTPDDLNKFR